MDRASFPASPRLEGSRKTTNRNREKTDTIEAALFFLFFSFWVSGRFFFCVCVLLLFCFCFLLLLFLFSFCFYFFVVSCFGDCASHVPVMSVTFFSAWLLDLPTRKSLPFSAMATTSSLFCLFVCFPFVSAWPSPVRALTRRKDTNKAIPATTITPTTPDNKRIRPMKPFCGVLFTVLFALCFAACSAEDVPNTETIQMTENISNTETVVTTKNAPTAANVPHGAVPDRLSLALATRERLPTREDMTRANAVSKWIHDRIKINKQPTGIGEPTLHISSADSSFGRSTCFFTPLLLMTVLASTLMS
ncbi:hypothetical protein TCDM_04467 [Trypanosoma cruzi Dm28c]|uniref:Uncharacterized protein n=1 Tax=Trypanosoma cruzi Dm28c TaxID=1416333 RepID=V5BQT9_TRYCR|nr:hypothetical protein TCDM_04467 [Trypanosoma cruzi Dm28c]